MYRNIILSLLLFLAHHYYHRVRPPDAVRHAPRRADFAFFSDGGVFGGREPPPANSPRRTRHPGHARAGPQRLMGRTRKLNGRGAAGDRCERRLPLRGGDVSGDGVRVFGAGRRVRLVRVIDRQWRGPPLRVTVGFACATRASNATPEKRARARPTVASLPCFRVGERNPYGLPTEGRYFVITYFFFPNNVRPELLILRRDKGLKTDMSYCDRSSDNSCDRSSSIFSTIFVSNDPC